MDSAGTTQFWLKLPCKSAWHWQDIHAGWVGGLVPRTNCATLVRPQQTQNQHQQKWKCKGNGPSQLLWCNCIDSEWWLIKHFNRSPSIFICEALHIYFDIFRFQSPTLLWPHWSCGVLLDVWHLVSRVAMATGEQCIWWKTICSASYDNMVWRSTLPLFWNYTGKK